MDIVYLEEMAKEDKKILFVNISKTCYNCHKETANCVSLGNWCINVDRAKKVEYVIGVCKGVIKSVVAVKEAKQLVAGFEEDKFPGCELKNCHRYQEKIYLIKLKENFQNYVDEKEYQRLNRRVYFIEDKSSNVKDLRKYIDKTLLTRQDSVFRNYVRYVNV